MKITKVNKINRLSLLFVATTLVASVLATSSPVANAVVQDSMYITPSSASVQNGNDFSVDVRANSNGFNAAQVDINYPASSLQYIGYSLTGSATPNTVAPSGGSGSFKISTYIVPGPITGDNLLIKLTFKAISGSGSASISFASTAGLYNGGPALNAIKTGSTINLTSAPAPTPPPATNGGTSAASSGNTGSTSTGGTSAGSTGSKTMTTNTTTTSKPAEATTANLTPATPENPIPADNPTPTKISCTIEIKDLSGKLVKNTIVKINGKELKTDNNGRVKYEGDAYGVLTVKMVDKDGKETDLGVITLVRGAVDQKYDLTASSNIASNGTSTLPILPIVSLLAIAGLAGAGLVWLNKYRQNKRELAAHGLIGTVPTGISSVLNTTPLPTPKAISSDNVTTTNPAPIVITPTTVANLNETDIAEVAKNIVEHYKQ